MAQAGLRVAITGAFTYSGRYITKLLLSDPKVAEIRNFTNHPNRGFEQNPAQVKTFPLGFDQFDELVNNFRGVDVLYCTYWMRYEDKTGKNPGLQRIKTIVDACVKAQVKRIIYVSHTKPSLDCGISYIEAKARAEAYVAANMQSYGFIRPCCIFGDTANESIVVNNTAYLMRKLPVMLFPGDPKKVHFQPVHVRDLAEMAVKLGQLDSPNTAVDAVGPEKFTFHDFMCLVKKAIGKQICLFIPSGLPASIVFQMTRPINFALDDVYVEMGDLKILENDIACSPLSPEEGAAVWGKRKLSEWMMENGDALGHIYINSFERYYDIKGKSQYKM